MKKRLLLLLFAALSLLPIYAYDFEVDGIYYNVNSGTSTCSVTYQTKSYNSYSGDVVIPESVTYNGTEFSVTSIGGSAFKDCSSLTSVTIPNSVTEIVESAFYKCSSLTSVTIPNSVTEVERYTFYGCSGLTSVTIPNSVTSIGNYAFRGCRGLISVTIPNSVTKIGSFAFDGCSGLTSVEIPNSVTKIGDSAFDGCSGLKEFFVETDNKDYSSKDGVLFNKNKTCLIRFPLCKTVEKYVIPNSVTTIGDYAFRGCSGLISITIPNSVTKINGYAFEGCSGLKEFFVETDSKDYSSKDGVLFNKNKTCLILFPLAVEKYIIPNSVTTIGDYAFRGCRGLISITIPNSVTKIGYYAFWGCSGLTSVTIPNSVTEIDESAFWGCSGLTSVTIPNSVTSIYRYTFCGCSGLTSVSIPNSVTAIGDCAFIDCNGLTSVSIPNSVTEIGGAAFKGCSGLTSVTIGNSVTEIGKNAFNACEKIIQIESEADTPPEISDNSFSAGTYVNALVTIPSGTLKSYQSKWSKFKHLMAGEPVERSFEITQAGTLMNKLNLSEVNNITSLKLSGPLNGTDLLTLNKMPNIQKLDLSEATIVSGGMNYYEEDNVKYGTEDNTLGNFWAYALDLLEEVKLPQIVSLGEGALRNKTFMKKVTIPGTVTSISNYAFNGCTALTDLIIEDGESTLSLGYNSDGKGLFYDCPVETLYLGRTLSYSYNPFKGKESLKDVTIGNSVTTIGNSAFSSCSGLTSVTIGNSVASIGESAFSGCSGLKEVHISDLAAWCKIVFGNSSSNPLA